MAINKSMNLGMYVVGAALIGGAFLIGRLSAQVEYLTNNKTGTTTTTPTAQGTTGTPQGDAGALLSVDNLKQYAKDLKLDTKKFNSCLDDGKFEQKIKDDMAYGSTVGVSGTPTFFFNGVIVVGAVPQAEMEKVIDAELKDGSGDQVSADKKRWDVETGKGYQIGNKNAKVKIVEFSDFQCPFCASAYPTVKAIMDKYGDDVSLEYRHYPLSFHPYAQKAGEAAECAGEQGKFWEMHDKLFELQS